MILSSGKSLVLLDYNQNCVVKTFSFDKGNEHEIVKDIDSKRIIKILNVKYSPYVIHYEIITPITRNINNIQKLVRDIALSLLDIHKKGYAHGDVYNGNIGINNEGDYILFDFEFCKKTNDPYDYYRDIEMFLTDYGHYEYINNLLKTLRNRYIIIEDQMISFLGKERKRTKIYCNYEIYDFINTIKEELF
jgi:serine/threonine protein kinase